MSAEGKLSKRKLARIEQWVGEPLWHAFASHPWVEFVTPDDRHGALMHKHPDPASTIRWYDEAEVCHWTTCPVGPPPSATPHYDVWRSRGAEYDFPAAEMPDPSTAVCPVCREVIHGDSASDAVARYGVHFIEAASAEREALGVPAPVDPSPLPWRVSDSHGLCVVDRNGRIVCDLTPQDQWADPQWADPPSTETLRANAEHIVALANAARPRPERLAGIR